MTPQPRQTVIDRTMRMTTETVAAPKVHEGVGAALRNAYLPRISDMPREIVILLERLY